MEYGSDFSIDLGSLEYNEDNVFTFLSEYSTLYFDSGRSATRYLLQYTQHNTIALPEYLCESIVDCFPDSSKVYYSVDGSLQIQKLDNFPWDSIDVFYLLHYFGSLQQEHTLEYILEKKREYGFVIIEDTTHSIFTKTQTIGDYCVCSLRKWFPIPDGGVLYSKLDIEQEEYNQLSQICSNRIDGMVLKSFYLNGCTNDKDAYRKILLNAENQLDRQSDIYKISAISQFILKCQSVSEIISKRQQNHAVLQKAIGDLLPEIQTRERTVAPYIYVTRVTKRDELRAYLTRNQVYCPVHWPVPATWKSEAAMALSKELISIPIDQRYGIDEVMNTAQIVRGFFNE